MLRRVLIGIAAVVALVIAGAIALVAFVDVNRFKPQIEQTAQQELHRRLAIEGDLSLAVFPRIALRLPRTTLFDRDGKQALLALDSARVSVALLPLLRGRVEVDRIRVEGLKARIRRAADGSTNIDDLLQRDRQAPAEEKAAESPREFVIAGIELVDAEISVVEPAGATTLTKLDLETGRIAPGAPLPIKASTRFSLPQSKIEGEARLKAELSFDPPARAYGAKGVDVEIKGRLDRDDVELKLASPRLQLTAESLRSEPIALTLKRGGGQPADVKLDIGSFSGTAKSATVDRIELAANLQQGARRISANLAGPAQLSVDAQTLALPKLAGTVGIDDPALAAKSIRMALTAALALDARKQALDLRADAKLDATTLAAKIGVEDFSKPRIAFDLRADQLDLDRYLAPAPAGKPAAAPAQTTGKPSTAAAPAQIDLSGLRALNASGQIVIGQLQARGIKAADVRITAKVAGGRADIAPISARLYGGTLNGAARAAAEGNRVGIDATLANVALGPLLKDALQKDPIEGRGNVNLALATAGTTTDAMKRALGGNAKLQIRDGAVRGIDIARRLREARALIGGATEARKADTAEKTDFSELNVSFAIRDGVASSDDLDLKSPLLRVGGAGKIDLAGSRIDYTARVAVVGTLTGQDGRALSELRGVTIPVRLAGPFDQLSYNIDWGGVAREALKSKLADELKKRVGPQADEPRKKLEERARDALKGLLGR